MTPNRKYQKGVRKERQTVHYLEDMGVVAFRSAGSHSPFDVVGVCWNRVFLIQVKAGKKPSRAEFEQLRAIKTPPIDWVTKQMWFWADGASDPEVTTV